LLHFFVGGSRNDGDDDDERQRDRTAKKRRRELQSRHRSPHPADFRAFESTMEPSLLTSPSQSSVASTFPSEQVHYSLSGSSVSSCSSAAPATRRSVTLNIPKNVSCESDHVTMCLTRVARPSLSHRSLRSSALKVQYLATTRSVRYAL
jgi:hypothetical protein